jgi:hypothetical protein
MIRYPSSLIIASAVGPLLITVLIFAASPSSGGDTDFVPSTSQNLLAMEMYYDIENLADAADALRQDAARFGLDISEHPLAGNASRPYSVLHLHVAQITPDFSDTSYLSALANKKVLSGEADESVAILAVNRNLSIDEVASLFESGIRILEKLFAGSKREIFGGYIVRGPAANLAGLRGREYFVWLGDYRADLKWPADLGPSSRDRYYITLYKRQIKDSYLADLEMHNATVMYQSKRGWGINVGCNWGAVQKLCELDWVRSMSPIENADDESY